VALDTRGLGAISINVQITPLESWRLRGQIKDGWRWNWHCPD
jgi:hypothetical protein